ncbi:polymorphic toxin-type HINT domain-containing protein, partial [Frigidibacter sp. SD6-1]|uniref:polymorphic toxin-type HINT domain-containing protein n=1 Tax=Frigidibacter sp. SD6-1 TaxID=3032581 RepID=UPI0024DFF297
RQATDVVWLGLEASGQSSRLGVTAEHPLYVEGRGWVQAGELAPGDRIVDADGGVITVVSAELDDRPTLVHNLEVAGAHTYFAGELEAWGHNSTAPTLPPRQIAPGLDHNFGNICPLPGVQVEHPPVHVNVTAGGQTSRVGQNGKPILGDTLNKKQKKIVGCNKGLIRKTTKKIMKWYRWHNR